MQETEAQAYAAIWDILMDLQKSLPRSVVYYGQDSMENKGNRYDALGGVFADVPFSEGIGEKH